MAASVVRPVGEQRPFQAEVITETYLDRQGFLWIGTREGLFLHDGQRFVKFQHAANAPDSISDSDVRGVFEDSRERLWIYTASGGLNLLDRANWRFRHFRHHEGGGGLSHDGILSLAEADHGMLWVGTQAGLDVLDPVSGRARPVKLNGVGGQFILTLLRDREGRLWVGTVKDGLFREGKRGVFERVAVVHAGLDAPGEVSSLAQDAEGSVWVGTRDGLFRYDATSNGLVKPALSPTSTAAALNRVTELEVAPDGAMWIGTFGAGLFRMDAGHQQIETIDLGAAGLGAKAIDRGAMAVDRQGGLIVGTFGSGLLRRASENVLDVVIDGVTQVDSGSGDVYSLLSEGDGLLVGSYKGGVRRLDDHVKTLEPLKGNLPKGVTTMLRARDGALWVGAASGLHRLDGHGKHKVYLAATGSVGEANPGIVYSLLEDRTGRIWAGTKGAGLYRYRPESDDFRVYGPRPGDPRSLSDAFVSAMLGDRRGRLWVGTRSGGINLCTVRGEKLDCERLRRGQSTAASSQARINDLFEAPDGSIWVGSAGGLERITLDRDGRPQAVRKWTRSNGLVDDHVVALERAPDGAMWILTLSGLSRLDTQGRFENYTAADGLPPAAFKPLAMAWHRNRLYWGSIRGVVSIDPARWRKPGSAPPVVFTAIEGLKAPLQQPPWRLHKLRVPWNQPFSIEFAVLSFDGGAPEYEYRLHDNEAWIPLGNRSQLTLHSLPPGTYQASVRGRQSNAIWAMAGPLYIEIYPPWWHLRWVQALAIVLAFVALALVSFWRMRALQNRNQALQQLQQQKETALIEASESRDHLKSAFGRLRQLTMRAEVAKEEERKRLARELHDEFGQALTAAKINLRLAATNPGTPLAEERTAETIELIERLIGQVRALSFDLRPPLLDDLGLGPALNAYLHGVAQRCAQRVDVDLPLLPSLGPVRDITVFRIVQEAVTNCLRHAGGAEIRVTLRPLDGGSAIEVRDNGAGFDADALLAGAPRGLGLLGMRERVEELGGRWSLQSRPGQGTTIQAFIPPDPEQAQCA